MKEEPRRGVIPIGDVVPFWPENAAWDDDTTCETYDKEGYLAFLEQDEMYVVLLKSPAYTICRPCSPCYPGAGDLGSPDGNGIRTFCPGIEWFEDDECPPFPVFRVTDGEPGFRTEAEKAILAGVLEGLAFTSHWANDDVTTDIDADEVWPMLSDWEKFDIVSDVMNFYHEIRYMELPWGDGPTDEFWRKVGVNFHLTRNGHGAGFWDLGWGRIGDRLTEISKPYGTCELQLWIDSDGLRGQITN